MCLSLVPCSLSKHCSLFVCSSLAPEDCVPGGEICRGQELQPVGQATRASLAQAIPTHLFFLVQYWVKVPLRGSLPITGSSLGTVWQRNVVAEEQKPLLDGVPISEFFPWCLITGLRMLRVLCHCGHRPACWHSLMV